MRFVLIPRWARPAAWREPETLPAAPPSVLDEDGWQAPRPWGTPLGQPWRADEDVLPILGLEEDQSYRPPQPWAERPPRLGYETEDLPAPVVVAVVEEDGFQPARPWAIAPPWRLVAEEDELPSPATPALDDDGLALSRPWPPPWLGPPRWTDGDETLPPPDAGLAEDEWRGARPWGGGWLPSMRWADDDGVPQLWLAEDGWQPQRSWLPPWPLARRDDDDLLPPRALDDSAWHPRRPWEPPWLLVRRDSDDLPPLAPALALEETGWRPAPAWPSGWPRVVRFDEPMLGTPPVLFGLDEDAYRPPRPWAVPGRRPFLATAEWVVYVPPPVDEPDGFTGGFSTATLNAIAGGSLLELIGLAVEGYRVRGLATTIVDAFGTSGGLTALLLGDPVLADRWGRQDVLTEGATTNQLDAHSASEPIAGAGGYALQIAVEGGLMDSAGRIRVRVFWERLAADVV